MKIGATTSPVAGEAQKACYDAAEADARESWLGARSLARKRYASARRGMPIVRATKADCRGTGGRIASAEIGIGLGRVYLNPMRAFPIAGLLDGLVGELLTTEGSFVHQPALSDSEYCHALAIVAGGTGSGLPTATAGACRCTGGTYRARRS